MVFKVISKVLVKERIADFLNSIKGWNYSTWQAENFLYELPGKWDFSFAVYSGEELAAFCFASHKIANIYYIHLLFVSEMYRGFSLGNSMIKYAGMIAKKYQVAKIGLRCPESNTGALEFYKRAGFNIKEKINDEVSGSEADYYLEKIIN